jgi:cytochrome P450
MPSATTCLRRPSERSENPEDDLISALVRAEEAGERLSEDELLGLVFLLLVAGHETTVNLSGNETLALLQHPDQLEKLRNDPSLIKSAIEELLRYDGPLETSPERFAREDVAIGGTVIPRGEMVRVVIAAADCDPERFPDPDALNITRTANRHLALGKGVHHCLGALLARMEGQIAIGTLLRRMPGFHARGGRRVRSVLTVMYLTMPTRRPAAARGRRRIRPPRVPRPAPPSGRLCSLARFCGDDLPRNLSLEPAKFAQ